MKKTKVICTLGPATAKDEILEQLMINGMNVARINFSHGTEEEHLHTIERVKTMREKLGLPVALLLDTGGPEIRLGCFENGRIQLKKNQEFILTTKEVTGDENRVSISYPNLIQDITEGARILIDDGLIELTVKQLTTDEIVCQVINGGSVSDHKGVNVPNTNLSMPFVNEKDKQDLIFGVKQDFDYVAASFVRCAEDVKELRQVLTDHGGADICILAKIENRQGVDNIDEILAASDGVMVARGDLGVEIPIQEVPAIQKMIIKKTCEAGKIVITATQMLDSMMKNPRPTRAEATDVANAIYDGTSAIMLSGETAAGKYPVEALRTMVEIAEYTERDIDYEKRFRMLDKSWNPDVTDAISHATCVTALDINAAAIVTVTKSGRTARMISRYRPKCPILGCTPSEKTYRQMSLSWGVIPLRINEVTDTEELFAEAIHRVVENKNLSGGDIAVITAGVPLGMSGTTNLIRVATI